MDLRDLPAYLRALQATAAEAVVPAANAMAEGFEDRVKNRTLRETVHPPGIFYKAVAGRPPAYASGNLARSVFTTPAYGTIRATALVGATAIYAALQEEGGRTWPNRSAYMKWHNNRGVWYKKIVTVPEHPYFAPTVAAMIRDGSLSRLAATGFYSRVSQFFRG